MMQKQRTFFEDLRYQFKYGGTTVKLLFFNVGIFLIIKAIDVFSNLSNSEGAMYVLGNIFELNTDFNIFITHPWTLFTNMFAHYNLWHILFNMVFLYFTGKMFEQLFSSSRLLYTYILAGLAGGFLEIAANQLFPALQLVSTSVIGASGAIMGLFMAVAFHRPNTKVQLFGLFPVRLIWLAVGFLLLDFFALGREDGTAHFAHLGGAFMGILSIQNLSSRNNIVSLTQRLVSFFKLLFAPGKKSKLKVKQGGNQGRAKSDEEYNLSSKVRQEQIDRILDKISKSGYDSLTKKEKDFLFQQSKNG